MPVPGTNLHRRSTSGAVRDRCTMVCVMVRMRDRRFSGQLESLPESDRRHHEAWIDYSSAFTLRDTTCHKVVKYVFSLIARLFSDQGIRCFMFSLSRLLQTKRLLYKPMFTAENGLRLPLLLLSLLPFAIVIELCYELMS
jgi:hypothetical protein